jgi:hypothetical protein
MRTHPLAEKDVPAVAGLMAALKPDWWDLPGAERQLRNGHCWFLETEAKPVGFLISHAYPLYKMVEIECLGFDDHGSLAMGNELSPLVKCCEQWAEAQGAANVHFILGSRGLSCHHQSISVPWRALQDLSAIERPEYLWFITMGYVPSGILPNIYGKGHHGILLLKQM